MALPIWDQYIGALTGVFEVGVAFLVLRLTRLGRATWAQALAFGIGFGVIEAFLLGLNSAIAVTIAVTSPQQLPFATLRSLAQANDLLFGLAPVVERFFFIWIHSFADVLILFAISRKQARWFWLAFWFKTLIEAIASYAQSSGMLNQAGTSLLINLWIIEAVVAAWGLIAWQGTRRVEAAYPRAVPESALASEYAAMAPAN